MHERQYNRKVERLRDPERIARLEVERVANLSLEHLMGVHTMLDVGTGSGLFAEQFVAKGLQVSGLDTNPEMLDSRPRIRAGWDIPGRDSREAALSGWIFRSGLHGSLAA